MSVVCCASTSWAQHKTTVPVSKLDSMQYLENVVVYAKKPYQEVIPAQTLSGKRLEGLNSHSVADAIRYFSGVQIKDYGGVPGLHEDDPVVNKVGITVVDINDKTYWAAYIIDKWQGIGDG